MNSTPDQNRLARLVEASRVLNSTTDVDTLLTHIIREAAELIHAEAASLLLLDERTRILRFKASSQMQPELEDMPVPIDSSIAGTIFTSNEPLIIADVSQDTRWNPGVAQAIDFQTQSILGVPMHDSDEQTIGVLEAINKLDGDFTQTDVETLTILADLAGVAVEKARLISELQVANRELNDLDQLKTSFIALASHELRTPLSIILGYVSFLRDDADPEMAAQLNSVLNAAVRLRSLIQDMLNFQYTDTGESRLDQSLQDFGELLRTITADKDETAVAKQQTIHNDITTGSLPVYVDSGTIEVVVNNLINNAIKFTPEGGNITVKVWSQGGEAWLSVADDGIGIPPDQLNRIFTRFYQVENHMRRHYEGMGLGLAIVKELVELQNGRVWVENKHPQGSVFYVVFPLATNP